MDPFTDEEYVEKLNKFSILLIELGVSHLEQRDEYITELFDIANSDEKIEENISKEISDLFFSSQLNSYIDGISTCVPIITNILMNANLNYEFMNNDKALVYLSKYTDSCEILINSAEIFQQELTKYIFPMNLEEIKYHCPEIIEFSKERLLQCLDNSFFLGLTDCRALYHTLTKSYNKEVSVDNIEKLLENAFPSIR